MASSASGGGGRSSPPPATAPRVVVDSLVDLCERAKMLQNMLQAGSSPPGTPPPADAFSSPPGAGELLDGMMSSLSSALSALDTTGGGGGRGQGGHGRRRKKAAAAGAVAGPQRRSSSSRRRSHSPFLEMVTASTLDDGNSWRKYGQKLIQHSPNPRSYYRCTHRPDQGCRATRQVQASDANPSEFVISYFGQHTCRDPSTIPLVIEADAAPPDCKNLISFGGSTIIGASTSTQQQTTTNPHPHPHACFDPTTTTTTMFSSFVGYSSSLPAQQDYRCGSEEVHSRRSSSLAAVVGSAGMASTSATVGSAPAEYWPAGGGAGDDMACAAGPGTGSFPSSPSSLGFMTGSFDSFGNAGDEDVFGFDP